MRPAHLPGMGSRNSAVHGIYIATCARCGVFLNGVTSTMTMACEQSDAFPAQAAQMWYRAALVSTPRFLAVSDVVQRVTCVRGGCGGWWSMAMTGVGPRHLCAAQGSAPIRRRWLRLRLLCGHCETLPTAEVLDVCFVTSDDERRWRTVMSRVVLLAMVSYAPALLLGPA